MDKLVVYFDDKENKYNYNSDVISSLFCKIIENDKVVFIGEIPENKLVDGKGNLIEEYNIYKDYYFKLVNGFPVFCKKDSDGNLFPINVEYFNSVLFTSPDSVTKNNFYFKLTPEYFEFFGGKYPLSFFVNNGIFEYRVDDFIYNDRHYKIDLVFNFKDQFFDIYFAEIVDDNEKVVPYAFSFYDLYKFLNTSFYFDVNYSDKINQIFEKVNSLDKNIENGFSFVDDKLDNSIKAFDDLKFKIVSNFNDFNKSFDDLKSNIDNNFENFGKSLSGMDTKLDGISAKIDNIKFPINDKGLGVLGVSLNGSAGAKFKDGDIVSVQGYNGSWTVLGSYLVLNKDNLLTILYALRHSDRTMLVPSVFVKMYRGE